MMEDNLNLTADLNEDSILKLEYKEFVPNKRSSQTILEPMHDEKFNAIEINQLINDLKKQLKEYEQLENKIFDFDYFYKPEYIFHLLQEFDNIHNLMPYQEDIEKYYNEKLSKYLDKQDFVKIEFMGKLEQAIKYHDHYPILKYRRGLMIFKASISNFCYSIIKHPFFEFMTIIIIILNLFTQAVEDPQQTELYQWQKNFDYFFLVYYLSEMILKIFSLGFIFGKNSYIKDNWNKLDFLIVVSSLITYYNESSNLKSLRILRILRPLRTVSRVKSLKLMLNAIFSSFSMLKDIIIIMFFYYTLFAIAGQQVFQGVFKQKCFDLTNGVSPSQIDPLGDYPLCFEDSECSNNNVCGKQIANPQYNFQNFDTYLWAFVQIFSSCTLEGWSDIMRDLQVSVNYYCFFYNVVLVFIGAFVIINLIMAVVAIKFLQSQSDVQEVQEQELDQWDLKKCQNLELFEQRNHLFRKQQSYKQNKKNLNQLFNDFKSSSLQSMKQVKQKFSGFQEVLKSIYKSIINNQDQPNQNIKNNQVLDFDDNFTKGINNMNYSQDKNGDLQKRITYNQNNSKSKDYNSYQTDLSINDKSSNRKDKQSIEFESLNTQIKPEDQEITNLLKDDKKKLKTTQEENKIKNKEDKFFKQDDDLQDFYLSDDNSESEKNNSIQINGNDQETKSEQQKMETKNIFTQQKFAKKKTKLQFSEDNLKQTQVMSRTGQKFRLTQQRIDRDDMENTNFFNSKGFAFKKQILYQQIDQNLYQGWTYKEAEQLNNEREYLIKKLTLQKQNLKVCILHDLEYSLEQQNDVIPSKKQKILDSYRFQREQDFYDFNFRMQPIMPSIIPQQKQQPKNQQEFKNQIFQKRISNLRIIKQRQNSIYIDQLQKNLNENYIGVKYPCDQQVIEPLFQKELRNIYEGLSKTDEQQFLNDDNFGLKNQKFKGKRKKNVPEINNYLTAKNNLIDDLEQGNIYKEFDNSAFYIEMKDNLLKYYHEGRNQLDCNFTALDIFKTYNNQDALFYKIIFKGMKKLRNKLEYRQIDFDVWDVGIQGLIRGFIRVLLRLITSQIFDNFIMLTVVLNTILMMLVGLVEENNVTKICDYVFTGIFILEFVFKIIGLSPIGYIRDKMNIFDGMIVIISIIDLSYQNQVQDGNEVNLKAFKSLRILRSLRVLRVTKLLRSLEFMKVIIQVLQNCLLNFLNILILMVLFIFIFTLLGAQMFGGYVDSYYGFRSNWDTIYSSFLITFQIMTLENWNSVMFEALTTSNNKIITMTYLYLWIFAGNYVLLNLFLAVLLDGFSSNQNLDDDLQQDELTLNNKILKNYNEIQEETYQDRFSQSQGQNMKGDQFINDSRSSIVYFENVECESSLYIFSKENYIRKKCYLIFKNKLFEKIILTVIVISSFKLVIDTYFDNDNVVNNSQQEISFIKILDILDFIFNGIFIFEMTVKVITLGFIFDFETYLRDSWCQLDFIIVLFSIIDMSLSGQDLGFIKIVRMLRILRPLRFISNNPSLKILVNCLLDSLGGLFNVILVIILIWMMFAILFMNLLAENSGYCFKDGLDDVIGINKQKCLNELNGTWLTHDVNFDNIIYSMVSLFVLSTLEGWPDYMYNLIDGGKEDTGPIFNNNAYVSYLFIVFIMVGSIFCVNLFVAIVGMNFHIAQEKNKNKFLNKQQEQWIQIQSMIYNEKIDIATFQKPKNPFKAKMFRILRHPMFDMTIISFIIGNVAIMALDSDDITTELSQNLKTANYFFTAVFIIEALFKIFVLEPRHYIQNSWNKFDLFIVIASIIDLVINFTIDNSSSESSDSNNFSFAPQLIRIFRVLRVSRILKLVKNLQGIQRLIATIIFSLPALINVTSLLFLVYFIFSVLGCFIFKNITFLTDGENYLLTPDQIIGVQKYVGFSNFLESFLTLFRQSTGEDWHVIMFDTTRNAEFKCTDTSCGNYANVIFFILFVLLQQYIMLNLFILVLMQNFEENYINTDNPIQNFEDMTEQFKEKWIKYCSEIQIDYIKNNHLTEFLIFLQKPLGLGFDVKKDELFYEQLKLEKKRQSALSLMRMNLQSNSYGYMYYNEVLFGFYKNYYTRQKEFTSQMTRIAVNQIEEAEANTLKIIEQRRNKIQTVFKQFNTVTDYCKKNSNKQQVLNPMVLFYLFRRWIYYLWECVLKVGISLKLDNKFIQEQQLLDQTFFSIRTITTHTESDDSQSDSSDEEFFDYFDANLLKKPLFLTQEQKTTREQKKVTMEKLLERQIFDIKQKDRRNGTLLEQDLVFYSN